MRIGDVGPHLARIASGSSARMFARWSGFFASSTIVCLPDLAVVHRDTWTTPTNPVMITRGGAWRSDRNSTRQRIGPPAGFFDSLLTHPDMKRICTPLSPSATRVMLSGRGDLDKESSLRYSGSAWR